MSPTKATYDVEDLISAARKHLEEAQAADSHNRTQSLIDLQFRIGQQWDETIRVSRESPGPGGGPPRPCITIDRLGSFCNQVVNDIRQTKPAPSVSPRDEDSTVETAEVIEGFVRRVLYDSDSELAMMEAAKYAIISGAGGWRLDARVVDEDTNRQELVVTPIFDPSTIWWDPFSLRPDKSDARWCLAIDVISRIEFRERWPESDVATSDFTNKEWPAEWMNPRGDGESVMIAEYWCVETDNTNAVALGEEDKDATPVVDKPKPRKPGQKRVRMHLINGVEELEPVVERPGVHIPIFWVEGDSFWVDGKRHVQSLIRSARDIQKLYNWEATKEVEFLAMQSSAPYMMTPTKVQNHEGQWQSAANTNSSYLLYNHDPLEPGPPVRTNPEAPIQAISAAKQATAQEIRDVIGIQDPSLGRAQSANQSGIAIKQLRSEGDVATYHYQDNLARTQKHFCKVLVQWIPEYYDIEQELHIMKPDMTLQTVKVNAGKTLDPDNKSVTAHDLTTGKYEVIVEVGPSYATAREEESAFISSIIQAVPEMMFVMGDLMLANRDSVGSKEASVRLKRYIALKTPGLIDDDENKSPLPPAAAAQMQALQAQNQQLTQAVQQMQMELKLQMGPKQLEAQTRMQTEKTKAQAQIYKTLVDAHTKLAIAQKNHAHDMYSTTLKESTDAVEHALNLMQESELAPTPDAGPPGIHPVAPPLPAAGAAGAGPGPGTPGP